MTAFGIVAILLSVLGVITPVMGFLLSALSGFLAIMISKRLDPMANAALVINWLNLTIFSPFTVSAMFSSAFGTDWANITIYTICVLVQLTGLLLWRVNYRKSSLLKRN
ncbi:hypothetical protein [Vibrio alginolyticus]|uniref:hypothetical protein n=1 Tax=Vibrio alginolyticus TaxID=663 RepID=UPI00215C1450|nr:hypothetical protein [Vibrio alginolyticus]ELB2855497.1 hypothetical protein [Vibrio alginolyticus]MCR9585764.1 hypothetical protein [Vibrio alginolyticus]